MVIVDSHCHASLAWYEPVETLLFQMERYEVAHAVLIQIQGQTNNDYQFECIARYPGRFASVVIIDTDQPDAPETLQRLAEGGAGGIRLRAATRSPGNDPLAIWRAASRLGIAVSCAGASADFASDDFAALVAALPDLPIVVEHLGSLKSDAQSDFRRRVLALGRFPNCYIKVTGLGEFCRRALPVTEPFPFEQPIPAFLDEAFEAFGPRRMMWGSDYPPVSAREGYGNALHFPMEQLAARSEEDRRLIFGEVARTVFPPRG